MVNLKGIGVCIGLFLGIVAFQNCSRTNFATTDALASENANNIMTGAPVAVVPDNINNPVVDIATLPETACQKYVELSAADGKALDIPARTSAGACYVVKIISAKIFSDARKNPNLDADIVSRNHDNGIFNDSTLTRHPYVLGSKSVRIILQGERSVKLSGGKDDKTKIVVDNFILVGLAPSAQIGDPKFYSAYGTKDSSVNHTNNILFKNVGVAVTAFASGGTSTFAPLKLSGQVEIKREYTLDVRALDDGAYGETSDIYILFK